MFRFRAFPALSAGRWARSGGSGCEQSDPDRIRQFAKGLGNGKTRRLGGLGSFGRLWTGSLAVGRLADQFVAGFGPDRIVGIALGGGGHPMQRFVGTSGGFFDPPHQPERGGPSGIGVEHLVAEGTGGGKICAQQRELGLHEPIVGLGAFRVHWDPV